MRENKVEVGKVGYYEITCWVSLDWDNWIFGGEIKSIFGYMSWERSYRWI